MQVRPARVEDAEQIEGVRIRGWQRGYRNVFPPEKLDALEIDPTRWRAYLEQPPPGNKAFVAEDEGEIVGFATIAPSEEPECYGELRGLYVDPAAWSRGIGRALLRRAEEELAGRWDEAVLWTLEDNPRARRFYELAGWRDDGERGSFEQLGVAAPLVHYRKRLSDAVPA